MPEPATTLFAGETAPSPPAAPGRPPGRGSPLEWLKRHTGSVSLDQRLVRHPVRDTWITVAAAAVVASLLAIQDWQAVGHEPYLHRFLVMDAIAGLVLAPLVVASYLTLRACMAEFLLRLQANDVIGPARDGRALHRFARRLDGRLDRLHRPAAIAATAYLGYTLIDALDEMHGPVTTVLTGAALAVQTGLLFLGVVTVLQIWAICRAVGRLVRGFTIRVRPLHPDGCGGLWPVGHLLSFVLYFAAILGAASLSIFLALPGTPSAATRRPEPYLLAVFYAILLPSALVNVLWRPHRLMVRWREQLLAPVADAFNHTVRSGGLLAARDPAGLRATTDLLSEISRRATLLEEACPAWPLRVRRLRAMLVTAVLPVALPVVTTILGRIFGAPA
jgi:hypothetical protein